MKLTQLRRLACIGSAVILAPVCPAATFVFGDSLSDTGNAHLATMGANPGVGYYQGRYSNGPVWVEQLATDHLGVAAPTPSLLPGGTNYAFAGAHSSGGSGAPSALDQINGFIGGASFSSTDLVVLWVGANDFLLGGVTDPSGPAANVAAGIQLLAGAGATRILVPNLPDLADTPAISSMGDAAASAGMHALTVGFNALLDGHLSSLRSSLVGTDLIGLDIFGLGKEINADPGAFGLANTTLPALLIGDAANANDYIYFDAVHPTEAMHRIIAGRAAGALAVPEPSAVLFLAVGMIGLVAPRRRAR